MNDTQTETTQPPEDWPRLDADAEDMPRTESPEARPPGWYQDQIRTPEPLAMPPGNIGPAPVRQRPSCLFGFLVGLSLIVALVSLALNAFLLYALLDVRQAAMDGLDAGLNSLERLEGEGFHYEYSFQDTLPVAVEIPVQQEMIFPFKGNFPINTTIQVPINAGVLGTFVIDVPIDTNVPVDVEVPIQISQTVAVSTSIPLSMTVPIDVTADDPAIQGFIDGLRQWLLELRQSFDVDILSPLLNKIQ
ncbi:MAG: hypothetical protein P8129_23655 [Anaerolineae bacterium]|jgi:hypothetical protein